MKKIDKMPKRGQFVAVWEASGELWANTYKIEKGKKYKYDEYNDEFKLTNHLDDQWLIEGTEYFIK